MCIKKSVGSSGQNDLVDVLIIQSLGTLNPAMASGTRVVASRLLESS